MGGKTREKKRASGEINSCPIQLKGNDFAHAAASPKFVYYKPPSVCICTYHAQRKRNELFISMVNVPPTLYLDDPTRQGVKYRWLTRWATRTPTTGCLTSDPGFVTGVTSGCLYNPYKSCCSRHANRNKSTTCRGKVEKEASIPSEEEIGCRVRQRQQVPKRTPTA